MEKLYTERIKREMEELASRETTIPDFNIDPSDLKKSPRFREEEAIAEDEQEYIKPSERKYINSSGRLKAMSTMLQERRWSQTLAIKHEIQKVDLIKYFHTHRLLLTKLNFEIEEEWRKEVVESGVLFWEEENKKAEEWKKTNRNLLDEFTAFVTLEIGKIPPRLVLTEKLQSIDSELRKLGVEIDIQDRVLNKVGEVKVEIANQVVELQTRKQRLYEDKVHIVKQMRKDSESSKRFILINALDQEQKEGTKSIDLSLSVRTVNHGFGLLDHYVKWYNAKNVLAILRGQEEQKQRTDKDYYNSKEGVQSKRELKTRKQERVYELDRAGMSQQRIVDQLEQENLVVSKSTVQRWLTKLN